MKYFDTASINWSLDWQMKVSYCHKLEMNRHQKRRIREDLSFCLGKWASSDFGSLGTKTFEAQKYISVFVSYLSLYRHCCNKLTIAKQVTTVHVILCKSYIIQNLLIRQLLLVTYLQHDYGRISQYVCTYACYDLKFEQFRAKEFQNYA